LNFNAKEYARNCISSVLGSDYPCFEVIFVDNGSTDGSVEYVRRTVGNDSRVRIVCSGKNLGFAAGNNLGMKYARGEFIVLLNNDTEVDPTFINEIVKAMESNPNVGASQPKIRCLPDKSRIDSAGGFVDHYGRASLLGMGEIDSGQYDSIGEIFYAHGACIALKKEAIEKVGVLDPSYFVYHEEVDLCWRMRLAGYRIVLVPAAIAYHWGGSTIKKVGSLDPAISTRLRIFHPRKNQFCTMLKNYFISNVIRYALPFGAMTLGVALIRLAEMKTTESIAYLGAICWILRNLDEIMAKRRNVQGNIRKVPDSDVMKFMRNPV
jgi:GT2 family glycosyltransferase